MEFLTPDQFVYNVGRRIAEIRASLGRTQEDVAEKLFVATKNYQRIERGQQNLTIKTMVRIAKELDVDPSMFWEIPVLPKRGPGRPTKALPEFAYVPFREGVFSPALCDSQQIRGEEGSKRRYKRRAPSVQPKTSKTSEEDSSKET